MKYDNTLSYQLNELVFYIPIKYKRITPFLLITDSNGNKDVLKLNKVAEDRTYASFSVSLDNKIAVAAGKSQISIMLIENQVIVNSQTVEMHLAYDDFTFAQRIQLFDNVSKDIAKKYHQIEQMTQMNIDIYQQIEEGMFK